MLSLSYSYNLHRGYNFGLCNLELLSKHPEKFGHIKYKIKTIVYDSTGFSIGSSENMIKALLLQFGLGMSRNLFLQTECVKLAWNSQLEIRFCVLLGLELG